MFELQPMGTGPDTARGPEAAQVSKNVDKASMACRRTQLDLNATHLARPLRSGSTARAW